MASGATFREAARAQSRRGVGEDRALSGQFLRLFRQLGQGGARDQSAHDDRHTAALHQFHRGTADEGVRAEAAQPAAALLVRARDLLSKRADQYGVPSLWVKRHLPSGPSVAWMSSRG